MSLNEALVSLTVETPCVSTVLNFITSSLFWSKGMLTLVVVEFLESRGFARKNWSLNELASVAVTLPKMVLFCSRDVASCT